MEPPIKLPPASDPVIIEARKIALDQLHYCLSCIAAAYQLEFEPFNNQVQKVIKRFTKEQ